MSDNKRRRIIVDDAEEEEEEEETYQQSSPRIGAGDEQDLDEVGSNPDEYLDDERNNSDEDGEDLAENWMADYAAAPELDYYDPTVLAKDDEEIFESYEKRMRDRSAAEEELDARDFKRREAEVYAENNLERLTRGEQEELDAEDEYEDDEEAENADKALNLEAFQCPLREWIADERTRREIHRRFKKFLLTYYVGIEECTRWIKRHEHVNPPPPLPAPLRITSPIYPAKISTMCANNSASLEVSYGHLGEMQSLLAIWLTDVPRDMLKIFDEVLQSVVLDAFPHYARICPETHIRIINLPISDRLRDLRQGDLNNLIRVSGVVTKRTGVFPQAKAVAYDCKNCGHLTGPLPVLPGAEPPRPSQCPSCSASHFSVNNKMTVYGNYQKLTLQEMPGSVPPGRVPRYKDVVLLNDLIDIARPGEEIEVCGIYQHSMMGISSKVNGFPVFGTVIEANCIQKRQGTTNSVLSEEDKRKIKELSMDPQIGERIIRSMAPSIYGHRHVKTGLALALFGGCHKEGGNGMHRVRGDVNILLLGDPGTAKSQILKYAETTAPRSVYTTGKGASAVGLTAGVHKDPITKEWTLEGGALVLADQGVCLIDEFDKMSEQDRTSIHEAMEQQTISVAKAGIVTSLQARCAVIAAANPIGGRYDASYNFAENVELTDPILQRFDILCVIQDVVDPIVDEKLATFVVSSHARSHPDNQFLSSADGGSNVADGTGAAGANMLGSGMHAGDDEDEEFTNRQQRGGSAADAPNYLEGPKPLDQALLKKYISYARAFVKPILHDVDSEKIAALYADLRQQSSISGGVPIAVRHIESIVRMAEASARMHLRDHVREDDIDLAIKVVLESFLQSQKQAVRKTLQRSFRKYITYGEENNHLLMHQLQGLLIESEKYKVITRSNRPETEVFINDLENKAKELNIFDLKPFYRSTVFRTSGLSVDEHRGLIIKSY